MKTLILFFGALILFWALVVGACCPCGVLGCTIVSGNFQCTDGHTITAATLTATVTNISGCACLAGTYTLTKETPCVGTITNVYVAQLGTCSAGIHGNIIFQCGGGSMNVVLACCDSVANGCTHCTDGKWYNGYGVSATPTGSCGPVDLIFDFPSVSDPQCGTCQHGHVKVEITP